jgi:hypothetical protein
MGYMQDANAIAAQLRGRAKPAPAKNRYMAEMARKGAIEKNAAGRWRFARGAR